MDKNTSEACAQYLKITSTKINDLKAEFGSFLKKHKHQLSHR